MITSRLKVVVTFILLCALLIIGYDLFKNLQRNNALFRNLILQSSLKNDPTRKSDGTSFIGETFVDFCLPDLSNQQWCLGDVMSRLKVIVIFSLDDCPLCLQEYPLLRKIDEIYQKRQIIVIGISHHTEKEELISFAAERNLHFPILIDIGDSIRNKMAFRTSPLRILLDANNKILEVAVPDANLKRQRHYLTNLAGRIKQNSIEQAKGHNFPSPVINQ